jgi:amino acid transporter
MDLKTHDGGFAEKRSNADLGSEATREGYLDHGLESQNATTGNVLHQDLRGRHMQMIAMQVQHPIPVRRLGMLTCVS